MIKYFPTKVNARNAYPDLCRDEQKQLPKLNNHLYYGKVEHGVCWKATRLIQIVSAISLAALTFGLLFVSKEFRKFLEGRIKEIKDPYKYIYIQEQFQKILPEQIPNQTGKQKGKEEATVDDKKNVEILNDKIEQEIKEENLLKVEIEELAKPATLQDHFNRILQLFQKGKMDAENSIEVFCQSLENEELLEVFEMCEKIEPLKNKENFVEAFVKAITLDQLIFCLNRSPKEIDKYKTVCGMVIFACHEKDENSNRKFNHVVVDLEKKAYLPENIDSFPEVYRHVFSQCRTINQLILILFYNYDRWALDIVKDIPLHIIHQKGWMAEYIELIKRSITAKFLNRCDDPKIYFALKNELIKQGKYNSAFLNYLHDDVRMKIENCNENEFKDPVPKLLDVKLSTQIVDGKGQLLEVQIYDTGRICDGAKLYELKTKKLETLGTIGIKSVENSLKISYLTCPIDKQNLMRLPILKAMHEFAIRQSFGKNLKGNLFVSCGDTLENFFFGYRFLENEKMERSCFLDIDMKELIDEYLNAKKLGQPTEEIINKIENFKNDLDLFENKTECLNFMTLYFTAKRTLNRKAKNMQEVIDYGLYFDKNAYLKRTVENDPFFHPKLKELFLAYLEQKDISEVSKKLNAPEFDDHLQRIYYEMKIEEFKLMDPANLNKIVSYIKQKLKNPIFLAGDMHLSEEKIEELKKEYQLQ